MATRKPKDIDVKDYGSFDIDNFMTSERSILNDYDQTDSLDFDQMFEGVPGTNIIFGGMQIRKKQYASDAKGIWIGVDTDGFAKINIGDDTDYMKWDGTSLTISGTLTASAIDIPDDTTANSFHVDSSGNMWAGATTFAAAPAKIANTGAATFTNITITGYIADGGAADDVNSNPTTIDGDSITTGTVTATQIDVSDLFAQTISATGSITGALLRTSSGGTRVELNAADNSIKFYSGGTLREEMRPTTLGAGGVFFEQGDVFLANDRSFNIESSTGGDFGGLAITSGDELWIIAGTDDTFFFKNNAQNTNLATLNGSGDFFFAGELLFDATSSNVSNTEGAMVYHDDGVDQEFQANAGGFKGSIDLTAI